MIYYTDDSRRRVSRFDAEQMVCETYDFTLGRWVFDTEVLNAEEDVLHGAHHSNERPS